jgi:hypothetical protein
MDAESLRRGCPHCGQPPRLMRLVSALVTNLHVFECVNCDISLVGDAEDLIEREDQVTPQSRLSR